MLTDRRTSSIHKPELLCNPAKNLCYCDSEVDSVAVFGVATGEICPISINGDQDLQIIVHKQLLGNCTT